MNFYKCTNILLVTIVLFTYEQVRLQAAYALGNLLLHTLLPVRNSMLAAAAEPAATVTDGSALAGIGFGGGHESGGVLAGAEAGKVSTVAAALQGYLAPTVPVVGSGFAIGDETETGIGFAVTLRTPWRSDTVWLSIGGCALSMLQVRNFHTLCFLLLAVLRFVLFLLLLLPQ